MEGASQKAAVLLFGLLLVLIFQACNANICNVPVTDLMACRRAVALSRSGTPPPPTAKCCEACNAICNIPWKDLAACTPSIYPARQHRPPPLPPTAKCCDVISHSDLRCICSNKHNKAMQSIGIDMYLLFQVPAKCKIPYPPRC
ncbi:hypothetical protein RHMOL_Rhmol12G0037800 [Rhododendron molle]|uniref:Uncharacterized protein n=1 Tax=Rhododendron molle TaxID=49168 RepID=A0ACC0LEX3_RHOML|nr:hypothetical protein RHMOL_Rhmol12G0037800 [Rhododendron molle]